MNQNSRSLCRRVKKTFRDSWCENGPMDEHSKFFYRIIPKMDFQLMVKILDRIVDDVNFQLKNGYDKDYFLAELHDYSEILELIKWDSIKFSINWDVPQSSTTLFIIWMMVQDTININIWEFLPRPPSERWAVKIVFPTLSALNPKKPIIRAIGYCNELLGATVLVEGFITTELIYRLLKDWTQPFYIKFKEQSPYTLQDETRIIDIHNHILFIVDNKKFHITVDGDVVWEESGKKVNMKILNEKLDRGMDIDWTFKKIDENSYKKYSY